MFGTLVLFSCMLFVAWLFARDRKLRPMTSGALWVVLAWVMIIGSRYVSFWVSARTEVDYADAYLEGSLLDRNVFVILVMAGAVALLRRRPDWSRIFTLNRWFFAFFIYCGISILWSDYPFVSFKRWTKELGNVIMVLIILTEKDPVKATIAILSRYAYFAIPLSVVLILFFPDIGMYYDFDLLEPAYGGVTNQKNTLGTIAFLSGLFLAWDLVYVREPQYGRPVVDLLTRCALLLMAVWLIYVANSKTALVCLIIGAGILFIMKVPFAFGQVKYIGTYSLAAGIAVIGLYMNPDVITAFIESLGRDATFTGRTDLWEDVLREPINPIVGTGYQSFWLGPRADYLWKKYLFHPIQAHNGYLETYLNGGLVGLSLLMAAIMSTGSKLKKVLLTRNSFGIVLFAVLVAALFYNFTEAMFSRLQLFWVILCIAALYDPQPNASGQRMS